ncbi:MAG: TlpA disulfide reductase family protein [Sideroxyarcus sp.]|nr:TlpA disulfide reductase family protein [Sideroxyarcus sp.]
MRWRGLALALLLLLGATGVNAQSFVFKDMRGQTQRLADYRGKWVLVNFWATWCPPCLEEIPDLVDLHQAHSKKDLVVIGVALESSEKSVRQFVDRFKVNYPIVLGDYDLAAQVGEVDVLPTSYLYNPQGELISYQQGMITRDSIESYIKRAQP